MRIDISDMTSEAQHESFLRFDIQNVLSSLCLQFKLDEIIKVKKAIYVLCPTLQLREIGVLVNQQQISTAYP